MNVNTHQCQEFLIKNNLYMVDTVVTLHLFIRLSNKVYTTDFGFMQHKSRINQTKMLL